MIKKELTVFMLFLAVTAAGCKNKTLNGAAARSGPAKAADSPGRSAMIVFPPDSFLLKQIQVETVATASLPEDAVVASGRIEFDPNRVSRIVLPMPGRIDGVFVRLGDRVSAGQELFAVDSPEADAAVSEFRQSLSALNQAKSALNKAQADLDRARELFDHKAIAKKDLMSSENDLIQAQAVLEQAEATREHCRRRLEILGFGQGDMKQCVMVKAPHAGKVIDLAVTRGEYRNDTTTPVMTVANLDIVWVTSAVPENVIRLINVGENIEVELVAFPGEKLNARVKRIADSLDPKTRTVQVQAELANPLGKFRPEMYGRIRHSHGFRSEPVVPVHAVLRKGNETVIYVERIRGTFERVSIVIGAAEGNLVPVKSGIKPGDRVVVNGGMLLSGVEGLR